MCWNRLIVCLGLMFITIPAWAQYGSFSERPRLVVQVVVGQMSTDEILKAKNEFDGAGIRTLIAEGTFCSQASYSHPYVRAASSLATLVTGANPAMHGVTGDVMYKRKTRIMESPSETLVPTLWDELLRVSPASKHISVAYTRQAALLLGGKRPSAAYWFDETSQNFVGRRNGTTSVLEREYLPDWVRNMNEKRFVDVYKAKKWQSYYPKIRYTNLSDKIILIPFSEARFSLGVPESKKTSAPLFRETPFADNLVKDFAMAAIQGEGLGKDGYTDVLSIYWDASRQVNNVFGPSSAEVQDTYFRLDDNLGSLIQYLNETIGKSNYLLYLTADAGGQGADEWMVNERYQTFEPIKAHLLLNALLGAQYGRGEWVLAVHDHQVFLDRDLLEKAGISLDVVQEKAVNLLQQMEGISVAYPASKIPFLAKNIPFAGVLASSFLPSAGDVYFFLQPGWKNSSSVNSVNSSYYAQLHVPLLFYGWKMRQQTIVSPVDMMDVVSTLSNLMDLPMPSGAQGRSIDKLLE